MRSDLARKTKEALSPLGVIAPPPIHVQTPTFDGSLATLFACVKDRKIELLDVPLFPICEAYFAYLIQESDRNLDEAAAALTALAYLLERKAWALLPVEEPEPEMEEMSALIPPSVQGYSLAIEALRMWQEERERHFFRKPDADSLPYELPYTLRDVSAADLARAFERLVARAQPDSVQPLGKPRRSLSEQMKVVLKVLSSEWRTLEELVTGPFTRSEVVYWFLALLELVRLGQAAVRLNEEDVQFSNGVEPA